MSIARNLGFCIVSIGRWIGSCIWESYLALSRWLIKLWLSINSGKEGE